jgi:ribosomal-protein-alanine N-acetyltransferase
MSDSQMPEFRSMQASDLNEVLRNERRAYTHPWSDGIFKDCLKSEYECRIIVYLKKIIGHGILSVAAGESHLLNVCIHPDCQGHGFGKILVEHMLERARAKDAQRIFLEVRPSNLVAYKMYENMGFNEIGIRQDYYPAHAGREDALVLTRDLSDSRVSD